MRYVFNWVISPTYVNAISSQHGSITPAEHTDRFPILSSPKSQTSVQSITHENELEGLIVLLFPIQTQAYRSSLVLAQNLKHSWVEIWKTSRVSAFWSQLNITALVCVVAWGICTFRYTLWITVYAIYVHSRVLKELGWEGLQPKVGQPLTSFTGLQPSSLKKDTLWWKVTSLAENVLSLRPSKM